MDGASAKDALFTDCRNAHRRTMGLGNLVSKRLNKLVDLGLTRMRSRYMFVLSVYTAALIGFSSVLASGTVFDTAVPRVEEVTFSVVCAEIVLSVIFPKSLFSAFEDKLRNAMAQARRWLADGLIRQAAPQDEMERRRVAVRAEPPVILMMTMRKRQ